MVELQRHFQETGKVSFIRCGRSGRGFSYHDIVTVADKETGQSLGKGRVNLVSQPLEDMLRSQKLRES